MTEPTPAEPQRRYDGQSWAALLTWQIPDLLPLIGRMDAGDWAWHMASWVRDRSQPGIKCRAKAVFDETDRSAPVMVRVSVLLYDYEPFGTGLVDITGEPVVPVLHKALELVKEYRMGSKAEEAHGVPPISMVGGAVTKWLHATDGHAVKKEEG